MQNNVDHPIASVESAVNFSPQWTEIYADGAFITTDQYAVRISFVNHLPQFNPEDSVQVSRKVDVVLSKEAFSALSEVIKNINENIRKGDA